MHPSIKIINFNVRARVEEKMKTKFQRDIERLFRASDYISDREYNLKKIKGLPKPVQRFFEYILPKKYHYLSYTRLKHTGKFKQNSKWKKIKGQEYFTTDKPGFIWKGKLPFFTGYDKYYNGKGNLKIKLLNLITIIDEKGIKLDEAELLRWLSEAPWYPTALLPSEKIRWETINDTSAKVILTDNEITVEGVFFFNEIGQAVKFEAKRFYQESKEDWIGYYSDYRTVDGIKVPFYVEVGWDLESGFNKYVKFQIEKIEFDIPLKF